MRASQDELGSSRTWGELGVANGRTLAARCDGRCGGHHWGYVITGAIRVAYPDHEEVVAAGDAYYVAPGHIGIQVGDAQLVDFARISTVTPRSST